MLASSASSSRRVRMRRSPSQRLRPQPSSHHRSTSRLSLLRGRARRGSSERGPPGPRPRRRVRRSTNYLSAACYPIPPRPLLRRLCAAADRAAGRAGRAACRPSTQHSYGFSRSTTTFFVEEAKAQLLGGMRQPVHLGMVASPSELPARSTWSASASVLCVLCVLIAAEPCSSARQKTMLTPNIGARGSSIAADDACRPQAGVLVCVISDVTVCSVCRSACGAPSQLEFIPFPV